MDQLLHSWVFFLQNYRREGVVFKMLQSITSRILSSKFFFLFTMHRKQLFSHLFALKQSHLFDCLPFGDSEFESAHVCKIPISCIIVEREIGAKIGKYLFPYQANLRKYSYPGTSSTVQLVTNNNCQSRLYIILDQLHFTTSTSICSQVNLKVLI